VLQADLAAPRLLNADPAAWPFHDSWRAVLQGFWASAQGQGLLDALTRRLAAGAVVYPPHPLRALELTPLDQVRVVILGQDPYHGPGQAEGLAFSVPAGVKVPPSLRNIVQEVARDSGGSMPASGSLTGWSQQGVLLLNTCLTVEAGAAASHARLGWEGLTDALIAACSAHARGKVFLLWGTHAQAKASLIDPVRHLVLQSNHPSPLSARRPPLPFAGCGHFSRANQWLQARGEKTVDWVLAPAQNMA
jgi:uracil-DNA glycosylase